MVCFTFMVLVSSLFWLIRSLIASRTALAAENLALRQFTDGFSQSLPALAFGFELRAPFPRQAIEFGLAPGLGLISPQPAGRGFRAGAMPDRGSLAELGPRRARLDRGVARSRTRERDRARQLSRSTGPT